MLIIIDIILFGLRGKMTPKSSNSPENRRLTGLLQADDTPHDIKFPQVSNLTA